MLENPNEKNNLRFKIELGNLKKEYKDIDIKIEDNKFITICVDEYKIQSCEDFTALAKNNQSITHIHHEEYVDVYNSIKNYIDNKKKIEKEIKINELEIYLFSILIVVIFYSVLAIFS